MQIIVLFSFALSIVFVIKVCTIALTAKRSFCYVFLFADMSSICYATIQAICYLVFNFLQYNPILSMST